MIKNNDINNKNDLDNDLDDDDDDDEYIMNLKKNFNIGDNVSNCSSDNDLNNYKLNNELVALANEVSKTFNKNDDTLKKDEIDDLASTPLYFSFNENDDKNKKKNYYDFDDECLLPEFDWANLEAKLKEESIQREYIQKVSFDFKLSHVVSKV
jgi:hypothetical protein